MDWNVHELHGYGLLYGLAGLPGMFCGSVFTGGAAAPGMK